MEEKSITDPARRALLREICRKKNFFTWAATNGGFFRLIKQDTKGGTQDEKSHRAGAGGSAAHRACNLRSAPAEDAAAGAADGAAHFQGDGGAGADAAREILIILNFRSCRFHFSGPYGMIPS